MTNSAKYLKLLFWLTLVGVLFSGYLTAVKLLTTTCAFGETCPLFLGYPACWYGFGLFLILFLVTSGGLANLVAAKRVVWVHLIVSFVGILFAGYLTIPELGSLFAGTSTYLLGLPTCAYGLIFYILIFLLSLRQV
jgi:hypothetical protein